METLASTPPLLRRALPVFLVSHQARGMALALQFAPGSLMVRNYELSLPSSSVNLSDDGCSQSGTSRHPLSPSPSLRFPLWAALAVKSWMSPGDTRDDFKYLLTDG